MKKFVIGGVLVVLLGGGGITAWWMLDGNGSNGGTTPQTITLATFNIQIFGKTKAGKADIMEQLAKIVRKYDVVAVQEIKDVNQKVPHDFLELINSDGSVYKMRLSPRTGQQADDKASQEQYAFYFNAKVIKYMDEALYDDSEKDEFQREPFVARFKAIDGNFTFVLISIHTRPEEAVSEIKALHSANIWARSRYPEEDDFITLGDFNASGTYAKPDDLDGLEIRGSGYTWIVPDDADTNVADKACAYDRIVITDGAKKDYADRWGVDKAFTDKTVSDHWPVWAEFYVGRDN